MLNESGKTINVKHRFIFLLIKIIPFPRFQSEKNRKIDLFFSSENDIKCKQQVTSKVSHERRFWISLKHIQIYIYFHQDTFSVTDQRKIDIFLRSENNINSQQEATSKVNHNR